MASLEFGKHRIKGVFSVQTTSFFPLPLITTSLFSGVSEKAWMRLEESILNEISQVEKEIQMLHKLLGDYIP